MRSLKGGGALIDPIPALWGPTPAYTCLSISAVRCDDLVLGAIWVLLVPGDLDHHIPHVQVHGVATRQDGLFLRYTT